MVGGDDLDEHLRAEGVGLGQGVDLVNQAQQVRQGVGEDVGIARVGGEGHAGAAGLPAKVGDSRQEHGGGSDAPDAPAET